MENEYPHARKEIPEREAQNKYGGAAREMEIADYRSFDAFQTVRKGGIPEGAEIADARFVYTVKEKPVGNKEEMAASLVDINRKLGARLRARGFAEMRAEIVSAPTMSNNALRTIPGIAPIKRWGFRVIDISRAYLQSYDLERALFTQPPPGAEKASNRTWRVKKPVSGLRDSAKNWSNTMTNFLKQIGARQSRSDAAM